MIFNNDKAIYIQIADRLCDEILMGKYLDDRRVPGVRDYSVLLEVNPNTVVKSYEQLETAEIIYKKRGLGYFVTPGAAEKIRAERRKDFLQNRLPEMFNDMRMLNIEIDDVVKEWNTRH